MRFHVVGRLGMLRGVAVLRGLHAGLGWNLYLASLATIGVAAARSFTQSFLYGWGVQGVSPGQGDV